MGAPELDAVLRPLRRGYVTALLALAAVAAVSQVVIQRALTQCETDAELINVAGRQRMLSQRLTKALLAHGAEGEERWRDEAREAATQFDAGHRWLVAAPHMSQGARQDLGRAWEDGGRLVELAFAEGADDGLRAALAAEAAFLPEMDRLVKVLEAEAEGRVADVRVLEGILLLVSLGVMAAEARGVFAPLLRRLGRQVRFLASARSHALELVEERSRLLATVGANEQLLATMGHEVRSPLNGVLGLNRMLMATPLTAEQRELAGGVRRASRHLLAIVDSILDNAKAERMGVRVQAVACELEEVLDDVLVPLGARVDPTRVRIVRTCDLGDHGVVLADPMRLRQVGHNLAGNAAKFTHDGQIEVSLAVREDGDALWLELSVADTGPGIAPDRLDAIFEPFEQECATVERTHGGTGLGLTISRAICRAMGGDLSVTSTVGVGTTFTARVRCAPHPDAALLRHEPATPARPVRALIVDDDPVSRRILGHMLRERGLEVVECAAGHAALETASRAPFDVVFLDQNLPGMKGHEVAQALRRRHGDEAPALVCISGESPSELADGAAADLFAGRVPKPFEPRAVDAALRDLRGVLAR